MNSLQRAWQMLSRLVGGLFQRRRQRAITDAAEAERLDRIRHPDKYLGQNSD